MEKKKQSSVEWLNRWFIDNQEATHEEGHAALKKAKAMHKEEQEQTWEIAWDESSKFDSCKNKYNGGFQQYYTEKFGESKS